jgi:RNA polymerase sigma-70 factor (ECF subfamily)
MMGAAGRRAHPSRHRGSGHLSDAPQSSDEELVRRVRAGDEVAGRLLFERHLPALLAKARARLPAALRGKVGASDVVQDAWLGAFLDIAKFEDRGDGSFAAWLRTILDRRVVDAVRHHAGSKKRQAKREVRLVTEAARLEPDRRQVTPSVEVRGAEEAARLRAVVDSLPDDYAAVIRLVHREGLTLVEAGACLGRTPDATRMLYNRAMDRLADRMGGNGTAP